MATKGQHVGGVSDALVGDPALEAARSMQRAALNAIKPQALRPRNYVSTGDGDVCPLDPAHRRMHVLSKATQWCANQTHDGKHGVEPTRNRWPVQFFDRAVAEHRGATVKPTAGEAVLPLLDITLEV